MANMLPASSRIAGSEASIYSRRLEALLVHISAFDAENRGAYGWPRIWRQLGEGVIRVGTHKRACTPRYATSKLLEPGHLDERLSDYALMENSG